MLAVLVYLGVILCDVLSVDVPVGVVVHLVENQALPIRQQI